jgi:hypothetical protein
MTSPRQPLVSPVLEGRSAGGAFFGPSPLFSPAAPAFFDTDEVLHGCSPDIHSSSLQVVTRRRSVVGLVRPAAVKSRRRTRSSGGGPIVLSAPHFLDQTAAQKARSQPYSRRFFSDHVLTLIGRGIQPQRVPCVGSHPVWSRVFCLSIFCFQNHGRANSRHGSTLAVSAANFDHQTLPASFSIAAALNNIRVLQTFPKGISDSTLQLGLAFRSKPHQLS